MSEICNTINHLRLCQRARAAGMQTSYTHDATWLVHQAINRRAGWLDDPSEYRGSAMPVRRNPNKARVWGSWNGSACAGFVRRDGKLISNRHLDRYGRYPAVEYPAKASGSRWNDLCRLAGRLNTPRLVVRETELGSWRKLILSRVSPDRITRNGEE